MKELTASYTDLWNSYISEEDTEFKKGAMEIALIHMGMAYVQKKVNIDKFKDIKNAEKKATEVQKSWMKTPLQEFDGKTPEEVILEERKKMGNPQKDVQFRIAITQLSQGEEIEKKAKELFDRGLQFMKSNKFTHAIDAYKEHLAINPENYVVWQNMGVSYMQLFDKKNARMCFEKALKINPDYKMAKQNLNILNKSTMQDIKNMAKEKRILWKNKGKEISKEEFDKIIKSKKIRKEDKKMKIEFTKEQYETLIKLVYLGEWMVNANHTDGGVKEITDIENYIYSFARDFGLEDYVVYDKKFKKYFPTKEFEDSPELQQYIDDYNDEIFWDDLIDRLAMRDFIREYGEDAINKMNWKKRFKKESPFSKKYDKEFSESGIDNLEIILKGKNKNGTNN